MSLSLLQYNIISYLLLLPVILNMFQWKNGTVAAIFGGVFVFFQLILWGQAIAKDRSLFRQFALAALLFLLVLLTASSIIYLLWDLSTSAQTFTFLLIPVFGSLLISKYSTPTQGRLELFEWSPQNVKLPPTQLILFLCYLIFAFILFSQIWGAATVDSILSPWDVLPHSFWLIYFLSSICFLLFTWKNTKPLLNYLITATHIFLSLSLAVIIYKIGFGFDPFIHQTAERLILDAGVVEPKTPYYIGQYGLLVSLHSLLGIPLLLLDKFFLPVIAALSLPLFWFEFSGYQLLKKPLIKQSAWLAITVLLIPFTTFIVTTPQGIANLMLIWIALASFSYLSNYPSPLPFWMLWLIGIAATLTHPLAGIPCLILLALLTYEILRDKISRNVWIHRFVYLCFIILGSISVTLLFLLNGIFSPQFSTRLKSLAEINLSDLATWLPVQIFLTEQQYRSLFFEFGYFMQENIWWILTLVCLAVAYWLFARRKMSFLRVYGLASIIFLLNAIILSTFVEFPELIQYEALDYASRLFQLAFWTLIPLIGIALIWLYRKSQSSSLVVSWVIIIFLAWTMSGVLFASYPRDNRYELGHQYSVSATDINTVKKIGENRSNNYVVLANQSVSAAAIKQFGFKTYFESDGQEFFYYPVPTSSPLYDLYLEMVNHEPSHATAQAAADLSESEIVYFVINDYWDNADSIIERAKIEADDWISIDDGKAMIFVYKFPN